MSATNALPLPTPPQRSIAEIRQLEHITKKLWKVRRPCHADLHNTAIYTLQWALLYWDKLEPYVQKEVQYAHAEGMEANLEHFQRRLATRLKQM